MPKCPKCKVTVGMWERGFICPNCMTLFSFDEGHALEGYDLEEVCYFIDLFQLLEGSHLLAQGANRVTLRDDCVEIDRLGDLF